jgi:hypothetical protein
MLHMKPTDWLLPEAVKSQPVTVKLQWSSICSFIIPVLNIVATVSVMHQFHTGKQVTMCMGFK